MAAKSSLFLAKLSALSHLEERKQKNCLNCNAQVHGKYCHICGQENIEPEESVWHLVTHFFNDITHFDGKFFSTLKLLIFKPGFLPGEYKMGRRASYLNPVRMYIFTSFIFFLVFFSLYKIDENTIRDKEDQSAMESILMQDSSSLKKVKLAVEAMDSAEFSLYSSAINNGQPFSKARFYKNIDSSINEPFPVPLSPRMILSRMDSAELNNLNTYLGRMDTATFEKFTRTINQGREMSREEFQKYADSSRNQITQIFGETYESKEQYDSLTKAGKIKDSWLKRKIVHRVFEIKEKYSNHSEKLGTNLLNILAHYFPQMLFISLPLFALFLKLIYFRHRDFYFVSHGIYSVHLYIFYFIALLAMMGLNQLFKHFEWSGFGLVAGITFLILFLYEYKAMRNFYGQGRGKTIVKFLLASSWRFIVVIILLIIFLFYSLLKV